MVFLQIIKGYSGLSSKKLKPQLASVTSSASCKSTKKILSKCFIVKIKIKNKNKLKVFDYQFFCYIDRVEDYMACLSQILKIPNTDNLRPNLENKLIKQLPKLTSSESTNLLRLCKQYQRLEPPLSEFPKKVIPQIPGLDVET